MPLPSLIKFVVNCTMDAVLGPGATDPPLPTPEVEVAHREQIESLTKGLASANQQRDLLKEKYDAARQRHRTTEQRLGAMEREQQEMSLVLEKREGELRNVGRELQLAQQGMERMREAERRQLNVIAEERRKTELFRSERDDAVALLNTRTAELRAAQVFLMKTDGFSDADVRRMVENINAEIFQTAALISDDFAADSKVISHSFVTQNAYERVSPNMKPMVDALRSSSDPDLLLQISLQGCMSLFAKELMDCWMLASSRDGSLLKGVHNQMVDEETQAVSGRWRSLTRQHIKHHFDRDVNTAAAITPSLIPRITDILLLAGASVGDCDKVTQVFGARLENVTSLILAFRKVIGEDIISCEYEPILGPSGSQFNAEIMEDTFSGGPGLLPGNEPRGILCTTELGLRRWQRVEGRGGKGEWERSTLLKSKVATDGLLEELEHDAKKQTRAR
ncbi:hypothetical protein A0H81_10515 [Grifola frondosa]|uniref:Uncharacterized protein n=1 Tax=Grifola frondosa TaxID=5627 RepID=A0A1C7LYN0_GRIFR|nr:hypothetical protein A0H81_10515 [Grifola frondosa]